MLNDRLDGMERDHQSLVQTVSEITIAINMVKLEQTHLRELFTARLNAIEKSGELQMAKMEQISRDIQQMGSDAEKTPAGRTIIGIVRSVQATLDEHTEKLEAHARTHIEILKWQNGVDGVLAVLKWFGAGGLIALGISILRMMKILP